MANVPTSICLRIDQGCPFWIVSEELRHSGHPYPPENPNFREPAWDFPAYYFVHPPVHPSNSYELKPASEDFYRLKLAERIDRQDWETVIAHLNWHYSYCVDKAVMLKYVSNVFEELSMMIESSDSRAALINWLANKRSEIGKSSITSGLEQFSFATTLENVTEESLSKVHQKRFSHRHQVALWLLMVPNFQKLFGAVSLKKLGEIVGDLIGRSHKRTEDYIRYADNMTSESNPFSENSLKKLLDIFIIEKIDTSPLGKLVANKLEEVKSNKVKRSDD
jgi:hypothetical protein